MSRPEKKEIFASQVSEMNMTEGKRSSDDDRVLLALTYSALLLKIGPKSYSPYTSSSVRKQRASAKGMLHLGNVSNWFTLSFLLRVSRATSLWQNRIASKDEF